MFSSTAFPFVIFDSFSREYTWQLTFCLSVQSVPVTSKNPCKIYKICIEALI